MFALAMVQPGWPNFFDLGIERFLNYFVGKYQFFDHSMGAVTTSFLFCGGGLILMFWYVLFDKHHLGQLRDNIELLFGTVPVAMLSVPFVRILTRVLPFRSRPMATPSLQFVHPFPTAQLLVDWSSFPSDHAVFFFALATGICFVSYRVGAAAYLWVVAMICFPRLYLGQHWPTDILTGAALGIGLAFIAWLPVYRTSIRRLIFTAYSYSPGLFFAALFLFTFHTATMFAGIFVLLQKALHGILG